jgi:predicted Zn-dependent peptidase
MMASLLGGQNTSRLWQRLREDEGLVYTVATHYSPEDDFGDMVTYLGLAPQRVGEAWTAVQEEMASLAANGPQEEELEHTRVTLNTVLVMNQETPDARVMRLGRYGLEQRRAPALSAVADELSRVTIEDVRRQAQVWVDGGSQALAAAGPLEAADCVRMGIMNEELPS